MTKTKRNLLNSTRVEQKTKSFFTRNSSRFIYGGNIFILSCVVCLAFAHFIQFTGAASEGFVLRQLNSKLSELKNENKDLSLKSAELQSIARLKYYSEKNLGMIASNDLDYLTLKNSPLSLK